MKDQKEKRENKKGSNSCKMTNKISLIQQKKKTKTSKIPANKNSTTNHLRAINSIHMEVYCPIYANCDEVREMIEDYLQELHLEQTSNAGSTGTSSNCDISQSQWLSSIKASSRSLREFRKGKGKGFGASNMIYQKAWRFFEQKRIYENKPKTFKQCDQEERWGLSGFPLAHDDGKRYYSYKKNKTKNTSKDEVEVEVEVEDPMVYDIELMRDHFNNWYKSQAKTKTV